MWFAILLFAQAGVDVTLKVGACVAYRGIECTAVVV